MDDMSDTGDTACKPYMCTWFSGQKASLGPVSTFYQVLKVSESQFPNVFVMSNMSEMKFWFINVKL